MKEVPETFLLYHMIWDQHGPSISPTVEYGKEELHLQFRKGYLSSKEALRRRTYWRKWYNKVFQRENLEWDQ
jgi:hypothetical protein